MPIFRFNLHVDWWSVQPLPKVDGCSINPNRSLGPALVSKLRSPLVWDGCGIGSRFRLVKNWRQMIIHDHRWAVYVLWFFEGWFPWINMWIVYDWLQPHIPTSRSKWCKPTTAKTNDKSLIEIPAGTSWFGWVCIGKQDLGTGTERPRSEHLHRK